MSSEFQSPDGRTWTVRRRWLPRLGAETVWGRFRRRLRQTLRRAGDVSDPGCSFDLGEGIVAAIVVVLVLALLIFVIFPLLVALVDLVILLLLLMIGVVARVVFRRPWTVEARADNGIVWHWRVVGWRASGAKCTEVAELLRSGITPPDAAPPEP